MAGWLRSDRLGRHRRGLGDHGGGGEKKKKKKKSSSCWSRPFSITPEQTIEIATGEQRSSYLLRQRHRTVEAGKRAIWSSFVGKPRRDAHQRLCGTSEFVFKDGGRLRPACRLIRRSGRGAPLRSRAPARVLRRSG